MFLSYHRQTSGTTNKHQNDVSAKVPALVCAFLGSIALTAILSNLDFFRAQPLAAAVPSYMTMGAVQ
jgi:hypothetical protein